MSMRRIAVVLAIVTFLLWGYAVQYRHAARLAAEYGKTK